MTIGGIVRTATAARAGTSFAFTKLDLGSLSGSTVAPLTGSAGNSGRTSDLEDWHIQSIFSVVE